MNQLTTSFMVANDYDCIIHVKVFCGDPELRKYVMDSVYLDNRDNTLTFEALAQNPDTLDSVRHVCVKKHFSKS